MPVRRQAVESESRQQTWVLPTVRLKRRAPLAGILRGRASAQKRKALFAGSILALTNPRASRTAEICLRACEVTQAPASAISGGSDNEGELR